nr:RecName: Full=Glutathione peroxidase [Lactiplantibacillus plantarum]
TELSGAPLDLYQYRGQVLLIPQFTGLLYQKSQQEGDVVDGLPSHQFHQY